MSIHSILFKMDNIKRLMGFGDGRRWFFAGGGSPILLLYGVLMIMALTSAEGYSVQKRETSSCYYNGTHFMEGSIVPTKEPCLMCKCQSKTLICALKVCPEQPIPPPRGCILVHRSGACCPYLQCSKLHLSTKNSGDRKKIHFLDYYEKEAEERLSNPNSYLRRSDDDDIEENGACIVNGTVYKSGSAMSSSSLCSYCYCINGHQKCVKPRCALPNPRCAPIFVDSACCPIRYDCTGKTPVKDVVSTESPNQIRRINNRHYLRTVERKGDKNIGCTVDGRTYPEGERISSQDPCQMCYCIRGVPKCTPKKCAPAIKGCTPRVPRGECCAVRYDCKIVDHKRHSSRKIEEEEESFDFFSILFGPDPDEPKPEAKNATELVVTEAPPVSSTSEKSFFDFLKAGLEFIDSNSDDLLEGPLNSSSTEMIPVTESATEVNTVRVEIVREPQTVYISKPDFNFPVRTRISSTRGSTPSTTTSTAKTSSTPTTTTAATSTTSMTTKAEKTTPIITTTVPSTSQTTTVSSTSPTTTVSSTSTTTTLVPSTTSVLTTPPATVMPTVETITLLGQHKSNLTIPIAIDLTKAAPEFQDLESDSLLKENITDVSNSLVDLESSEEYSDFESEETSTIKNLDVETISSTTETTDGSSSEVPLVTESTTTTSAPIDVVIKIDDAVSSSAVESIINSLNAKIEIVEPIPVTTTIATKRPNNKFVGFEVEKTPSTTVPTTIVSSTLPSSTEEATTEINEITTEGASQEATTTEVVEGGYETTEGSTVDYRSDEMLVEDMFTTELFTDRTTTEISEEYTTETTIDSFEVTSTIGTTTFVDEDKMEFKSESETEIPVTEQSPLTTTKAPVATTTQKIKTTSQKNTTKPLVTKENNLLSVLLTELSNIFDSTRNDSGKQNAKNKTEFRPVTPKPIPIGEFHRPSSIPSILESDIDLDYSEPTLPPSLPNLKIIPFLPADAVKKNEAPIPLAAPYDFYKPKPTNYPIITENYESYSVLKDHEIHPGRPFKPPKYDYSYDQSLAYPALTERYDLDGKSNHYNTKIIRDKYDSIADGEYEYDTDALAKYDIPAKKELFKNELKKFIPTKYEVPQEGTYVPVYDKYGVGYPEKNVYYSNHKETYEPVVYKPKLEINTGIPLLRLEEKTVSGSSSGFSPPTKTEGGFLPKDHIKDDFYYEPYVTTVFPMDKTTEDFVVKKTLNTTAMTFGATLANPFINAIHPEPAPPLISLIEDKEKLFSVYHTVAKNNHTTLDDLLDTDTVDSSEYDKQIISITTDANYLSTMSNSVEEVDMVSGIEGASALPLRSVMNDYTAIPVEMESTQMVHNSTEPEPNGMFSLEHVLNYLFREEEPQNDNGVRNTTSTTPGMMDGVPPFKTIPTHLGSVYSPPTSIEASLGEVQHHEEDDEQHDGTVTLKIENVQNGTEDLYRPSLMDLPFLNPNFHSPSGTEAQDGAELKNDIDRFGYDPDVEHYQVISDGPPNTIPNTENYVVNPVDINKLKQHHSEGTAEITMKSKVYSLKDTVGILKLAGCNIYGRMYRVGRIISELSGPCLECKCTDVGVHCTPLNC